ILPNLLENISMEKMYYYSSILFGVSLLGSISQNIILFFISVFLIGLFSQWLRTTNRIYFQHRVKPEHLGKILSVVMMSRLMILFCAMIISFLNDFLIIIATFIIIALSIFMLLLIFAMIIRQRIIGDYVV